MAITGSNYNKTVWDYILKKPIDYTPKPHYHYLNDIIDIYEFLTEASSHAHANKAAIDKITEVEGAPMWNGAPWPSAIVSIAWTAVTGKPTSFYPVAHTHPISAVSNLQETINTLALRSHTHAELHVHSNLTVIGRITESSGRPLWDGNPWPASGSIEWDNILNPPESYTPAAHTHIIADVTGLTTHTHTNKEILDTYDQLNSNISDAVLLKHSHANINTINKITESDGSPLWNGGVWPTSSIAWANISNKPENIEITISNSHTHSNKSTIDKITELDDQPLWNGEAWPGTSAELAGYMTKAVYDIDNDGIVDVAETANSVHWANITNKPSSSIGDIDSAVTNSHVHGNQATIDKITENEDLPLWNGAAWPNVGDMLKSTYDSDGDNKVEAADVADIANAVAWANVTNKPTASVTNIDDAVTNSHTHSNITTLDSVTEAFTTELKTTYDGYNDLFSGKQNLLGFTPEDSAYKGVANGYASLGSNGLVPTAQLPAGIKECDVVADITARDALTEFTGLRVFVIDATDDATVSSGGADYIYDGTNWVKIGEAESMDVITTWANITSKPTSTVGDIDTAVTNSHTHTNKTALDKITESAGSPLWNGSAWPGSGTGGDMSKSVYDTNDNGKVDEADLASSVPWSGITDKPESSVTNIDAAVDSMHTHTNKTTLDSITEAFTTELKATYDGYDAGKQDALGFTPENIANKGAVSGYASLDSDGLVPNTQLPALVKASSTDITAGYLNAKVKNSIVIDSDQLQLSGDATTPGNQKYYGTNASGTKGYYDLQSEPILTTTTLVPSTYNEYVALYTNSTGGPVELDFASIINTSAASRDVYLRIVASDGTTLVHTILSKTVLATQTGIEVEDGKYVIANGQILQCQTSDDLTEFYAAVHTVTTAPYAVASYIAATWTDLVNNTSGGSQRVDLISVSNPLPSTPVSVQLRIVTSGDVLVNTVLPATNIEALKGLENKSGRWILANTQKLQFQISVIGCDIMATTKANS